MKLKPCPFCGGLSEPAIKYGGSPFKLIHHKQGCYLKSRWYCIFDEDKDEVSAWNRRNKAKRDHRDKTKE